MKYTNGLIKPLETIQDRIKHLRVMNDMTMIEVGKVIKLERGQISNMERGLRNIGYQEIQMYADLFRVSPTWIVSGKE